MVSNKVLHMTHFDAVLLQQPYVWDKAYPNLLNAEKVQLYNLV